MDQPDKNKIMVNGAAGLGVGALLPSILEAVPPKYQPFVSAGIAALTLLAGLFQHKPKKTK